ncbi:MAG: hypothetical protein ACREH8_17540 [Opitutaceae bacterium]
MASPFRFLRAGPPPPKVALLPDALFFTRAVVVTKGATPAEAGAQLELALEGISPFPLSQLYYGWYWLPGSEYALTFAAYRRRFTPEQTAEWEQAELVLPAFAAVLGAEVEAGTTVVLNSIDGLTGVHWTDARMADKVVFRPLEADATDDDRGRTREALLRDLGGSRKVIDLESPLAADASASDGEIVFRAGDFVSLLPASATTAIDVRDKSELASLRNARRRDIGLWRVALACAAALLLLGAGELALMSGRAWLGVRERLYAVQKPRVDRIEKEDELTRRIEDLATKRLLPLEMVTQVVGENNERIPADIQFTRVHAEQGRGLYTLFIAGKTDNAPQVNAYEAALKNLPSVQSAEARFSQVSGARATFDIIVVFKPGALNPTGSAIVSTP